MQEASKILNTLSDFGIGSMEELEEKISSQYDRRYDVIQGLNGYEQEIISQRELLKMLNTYWNTKVLHDEYLKSPDRKKFRKDHSHELTVYESSKEWLKERYSGKSLPNRSTLEMKISETESRREALLEEYSELKKTLKKLESVHEKIETYTNIERSEEMKKKNNGELE